MQRLALSVLVMLLFFGSSKAQDTIVKTDSSRVLAKVTGVNSREVHYKRFDNLDGPDSTLLTFKIARIVYQNGSSDVFTRNSTSVANRADNYVPKPVKYKNYFSLNGFDLLFGLLTVNYERNIRSDA